jgi:hypothetical protein
MTETGVTSRRRIEATAIWRPDSSFTHFLLITYFINRKMFYGVLATLELELPARHGVQTITIGIQPLAELRAEMLAVDRGERWVGVTTAWGTLGLVPNTTRSKGFSSGTVASSRS